jgi:hypothetical protein
MIKYNLKLECLLSSKKIDNVDRIYASRWLVIAGSAAKTSRRSLIRNELRDRINLK